jgi:8-oxo-dGTP pyrophosphatase MutT (NUDIX family)
MAPSEPRPAASVILMRSGGRHSDRALEVLLLRRSPTARFMPNVWVFPGGALDPGDGEGDDGFRACAVRELHEEAGIALADEAELLPWARWITPEVVPIRFDALFFVAVAPPHSPPRPDGTETVEAGWIEPGAALDAHSQSRLSLVFPTIKQLESLLPFASCEEALDAARNRPVETTLPRVVIDGDEQRILLPGEPGYDA